MEYIFPFLSDVVLTSRSSEESSSTPGVPLMSKRAAGLRPGEQTNTQTKSKVKGTKKTDVIKSVDEATEKSAGRTIAWTCSQRIQTLPGGGGGGFNRAYVVLYQYWTNITPNQRRLYVRGVLDSSSVLPRPRRFFFPQSKMETPSLYSRNDSPKSACSLGYCEIVQRNPLWWGSTPFPVLVCNAVSLARETVCFATYVSQ